MIDPAKQAEYPILLGGKLAGKDSSKDTKFVNLTYNYKTKGTSPQQKATITRGDSRDLYNLTIQSKAGNAEQTSLKYVYNGSVDPDSLVSEEPSESRNLVLVYDAKQKAFILEPVSTKLNFNLRSAPGKTDQQVADQYAPLNTLASTHSGSDNIQQDGGSNGSEAEDAGDADEDNPYDFRHFLPKAKSKADKPDGDSSSSSNSPDTNQTSVKVPTTNNNTKAAPAASNGRLKPEPRPAPKRKQQTNPLRQQQKKSTKPVSRADAKPAATTAKSSKEKAKEKTKEVAPAPAQAPTPAPVKEPPTVVETVEPTAAIDSFQSDEESKPQRPAASPSSNIIVDGDLIIDMGSPPPQRPAFKINPRHFASNNTSANEAGYGSDDEDELDDRRSPSPERPASVDEEGEEEDQAMEDVNATEKSQEAADDPADYEDDLVAEMEAALEESAREEEEKRAQLEMQQQQHQHQYQRHVESEDESEVSEEE